MTRITTIMYDFFTLAHIQIFFHLTFLIIGSHSVFNSILGDLRGFNKGRSSKFREGFRVRKTPEEG